MFKRGQIVGFAYAQNDRAVERDLCLLNESCDILYLLLFIIRTLDIVSRRFCT